MPYGYLVTVLIWGTVTAVMLRPPRCPVRLARLVYLLSVVPNEVPVFILLLLGLNTAQAVVLDQVHHTWMGILALLLVALVAAGMCRLQWDVAQARGVVERTVGVPAGSRPSRWAWLLPLSLRPREVERVANLRYAPGGREHLMDLYRRRNLTAPAPVLIYFHGGEYFGGSKHFESGPLKHRLAQRGWVVLSANYGLRPEVDWPGHLVDAKRVIAWVHAYAQEHGLDPSRIVMSGSSAGAHLAVHCALTADDPRLQPGFEEVDTHLAAAVGLYGYYGRYYGRSPEEQPYSHPVDLPAGAAPPIALFHGDRDTYAPVQQARELAAHLLGDSAHAVDYAELPGAQHGFDVFASPRFRAVLDGVEHFLDREVTGPTPTRPES